MKYATHLRKAVAAFGMIALLFGAATAQGAETYRVDPVHSSVVFRIKHLNVTYVYGRFNDVQGRLILDDAAPENNAVTLTVQAGGIDTNNEKRDAHLKSPDFFNVTAHSQISFQSRSFQRVEGGEYVVEGDLTLLGVIRPLTVRARHTGSGKDPWGGYRTGFETTFTIRRSDFGMRYLLEGVGDAVTLHVSIEAVRQ